MNLWKWLTRKRQPVQLELPFHCAYYNDCCEYFRDSTTQGFYARCWKCGIVYDPVCDR